MGLLYSARGCVQHTCMIQNTRGVGPGSKFLDFRLFIGLVFVWAYNLGLLGGSLILYKAARPGPPASSSMPANRCVCR
jgi:hypothetical protein